MGLMRLKPLQVVCFLEYLVGQVRGPFWRLYGQVCRIWGVRIAKEQKLISRKAGLK